MNILHIISGIGVGGAETFLLRLATVLKQRGARQTVISLNGGGALVADFEAAGVPVVDLNLNALTRGWGPCDG
ncbi:hypothetical protein [Tardiphaga alba]|uniref:hypothetical protein n=1 Tax=Tardiphaga alba TaxID=340268 RepID=UPI001BADFF1C|nr:hypothetical protein [Tardiphaga alba]